MISVSVVTVFMFDALRVAVTMGSRAASARIAAGVVVAVLVVVSIPLIDRANRNLAIVLVGAMGLARIAIQVMAPEPSLGGQIIPAAIVVGLFGATVAVHALIYGGRPVGLGVLVGSAFDIALLSGSATLPLPWVQGVGPLVGILVAACVAILALLVDQRLSMPVRATSRVPAVGIVAVGAWVGLHVMLTSNLGWIRWISGGDPWLAVVPGSVGIAGALVWQMQGRRESQPIVAATLAAASSVLLTAADSIWAAALLTVIAGALGVALTGMLERDSLAAPERVQWASGSVPLLALAPVVIKEESPALTGIAVTVVVAVVLLVAALLAARHSPIRSGTANVAAAVALVALAVALVGATAGDEVSRQSVPGELLVATYGLDGGFTPSGSFDPYAGAQVVLDLGADVLALQNLTRGRVMDGATDLPEFLARRTGTRIEWFGGGDGFGSAVEIQVDNVAVADRGTPGVAHVIEIISGEGEDAIRVLAVDATGAPVARQDVGSRLVDLWDGTPHTVFAGTFDAGGDAEPVATMANSGLFDVTLAMQEINPLTYPADLPTMQLDFILISPDLRPTGARIGERSASSHLPVISRVVVRKDP
jgi:endonuclease/exonuclease/phosphatase family metal-dependent hydrolase